MCTVCYISPDVECVPIFILQEELYNRRLLDPAQLLHGLEGWCSNFTEGNWWSYEYCHPESLIQFHIDSKTGNYRLLDKELCRWCTVATSRDHHDSCRRVQISPDNISAL